MKNKKNYILFGGLISAVLVFLYQYVIVTFRIELPVDGILIQLASFVSNPWFFPVNILVIFAVGGLIGYIFGMIKNRNK